MNEELDPTVPHPSYEELARRYQLTLDAFTGDIKPYVPALNEQGKDEFEAYIQRAALFNVVERTASAIIGALTRKPFTLKGTFPATDFGSPDIFLQYQFRDMLLGGRTSILVDAGTDGRSRLVSYDADDVINWSDTFKIIKEVTLVPDKKNPYKLIQRVSWRELYLEDGAYFVRRWTKDEDKKLTVEELPPLLINGRPLDFIPLFPCTPYDNTWDSYNPPLFTQACLQIQHFKQAIDLGHYAHFLSIPTFCIVGDLASYDEQEFVGVGAAGATESGHITVTRQTSFKLGSTKEPLHLTTGSSAMYVEASGQSGSFLQENLTKIEERMFLSGSRLLTTKKGVESVEALHLRAASEGAVLETITNALETAINQALQVCALIDRTAPSTIELNKDFAGESLSPPEVASLLSLYSSGAITLDQLTQRLYAGEVVDEPNDAQLNGSTININVPEVQ